MTEAVEPEMDAHEKRLKKLEFRSQHRGIKELDILVGGFARKHLRELSAEDLYEFECLMTVPDQTFYSILRGDVEAPDHVKSDLLDKLIAYTAEHGI
ncbi:FAD assembly factor SdhE [Curvivirga aplysinae]|uniref:FAD assembly factor SdhE n=1 Tax=Curvivirga aplysinae TaxID=2529852 RepID=UPI0012BBEBB6|nr:succinate dehydrogenase assembly factor 2 [Curvivirga aplysinae]MTI10848.1 succinate dehydrogenase assembly factor 2 [Curvivirga aplysinae]